MAERRKGKKKMERGGGKEEEKELMTKLQKSVVNWLKKNVPTKKTKFMHSHVVEYFSSAKALDALMKDSPWAPEKAKEGAELKFDYREQAIDYMADLLRLNMFHRAKKIPVAEKEKKKKKDETDNEDEKDKKSKTDDKKVNYSYTSERLRSPPLAMPPSYFLRGISQLSYYIYNYSV